MSRNIGSFFGKVEGRSSASSTPSTPAPAPSPPAPVVVDDDVEVIEVSSKRDDR
jgi:hypothetical protein